MSQEVGPSDTYCVCYLFLGILGKYFKTGKAEDGQNKIETVEEDETPNKKKDWQFIKT